MDLSNATGGATFADSRGVFTIKNDDFATKPKISISDASVREGDNGKRAITFSVTLDKKSDKTVTVKFKTINGTAKSGVDFDAAGVQSVVIQNNDTANAIVGRTAPTGIYTKSYFGNYDNIIIGSTDLDTGSLIEGGNGNDTITASAGPDTINGGRGTDAITRTVFSNAVIPIGDDISPGDTVASIEAIKVINASLASNQFGIGSGTITVQTPQ